MCISQCTDKILVERPLKLYLYEAHAAPFCTLLVDARCTPFYLRIEKGRKDLKEEKKKGIRRRAANVQRRNISSRENVNDDEETPYQRVNAIAVLEVQIVLLLPRL